MFILDAYVVPRIWTMRTVDPDRWSTDLGLAQDRLRKPRTSPDYWSIGLSRTDSPQIGPGSLQAWA